MKVKDVKTLFHDRLDPIYGKNEVESFFYRLLEHYTNENRLSLVLQSELSISRQKYDAFRSAIKQLQSEVPIQYIIGETPFMGLRLKVTNKVLIPRPETEELVDLIIRDCNNLRRHNRFNATQPTINILDIGTGSGCIAITLAKNIPKAIVFALDVCAEALQVAQENATYNNIIVDFKKIDVLKSDLSDYKDESFDIIVSNPPYVREQEKKLIKNNVLLYEPHKALFVDDNKPLIFYNKIIGLAQSKLKDGGILYFEINESLGKEMEDLFAKHHFSEIKLQQDTYGKNRFIQGKKICKIG